MPHLFHTDCTAKDMIANGGSILYKFHEGGSIPYEDYITNQGSVLTFSKHLLQEGLIYNTMYMPSNI